MNDVNVKSGKLPEWLSVEVKPGLITQIVHTQEKLARIKRAHTKQRGENRGGGAKPWRQKGTGRARHGSRRSPLWVGGAVTFGPRSQKSVIVSVRKKMANKALQQILSGLNNAGSLQVIGLSSAPTKTSEFVDWLGENVQRGLKIVVPQSEVKAWQRVSRNVRGVEVLSALEVNARDLVQAERVLMAEEAILELETRINKR